MQKNNAMPVTICDYFLWAILSIPATFLMVKRESRTVKCYVSRALVTCGFGAIYVNLLPSHIGLSYLDVCVLFILGEIVNGKPKPSPSEVEVSKLLFFFAHYVSLIISVYVVWTIIVLFSILTA